MKSLSYFILFFSFINGVYGQHKPDSLYFIEFKAKYVEFLLQKHFNSRSINRNVLLSNDYKKVQYEISYLYNDSCSISNKSSEYTKINRQNTNKIFSLSKRITLTQYVYQICGNYEYCLFEIYDKRNKSGIMFLFKKNILTGALENQIKTFIF